jgi:hypothetical protein
VHLPALGERLALDPAQDLAAVVVGAQPPRGGVEARALQVEQDVADELRIRSLRPPDRPADADDALVGRAAGEQRTVFAQEVCCSRTSRSRRILVASSRVRSMFACICSRNALCFSISALVSFFCAIVILRKQQRVDISEHLCHVGHIEE